MLETRVYADKAPLLYGIARSGTNFFYQILATYLWQNYQMPGLHEFFSIFGFKGPDGRQWPSWFEVSHLNLAQRHEYEKLAEQEVLTRLALLRAQKYYCFQKTLAGTVAEPALSDLKQNYHWIFIERRNLFDQLLSFLTSLLTGRYYEPNGISVPSASLRVTKEQFKIFEARVFEYRARRLEMPDRPVLIYEDWIERDPRDVLKFLGMDREVDFSGTQLPEKQNRSPKELYFENIGEIRSFYKDSLLQVLSPQDLGEKK